MSTSGLEVKRQALLEHRENTDKEIAELDKQIEAENEPKWGDVKFYNGECSDPVIYLDGHFYNYRHQIPANDTVSKNAREMPTEFNLFADLKALKEPLFNFSLDVHDYCYDKAFSCGPFKIAGNWHTLEEAEAFSVNIRRLIATAKAKNNE